MTKKQIKIISVADTHRQHWNINIPECDIFVFAGDAELDSLDALKDFNDWLGTIKAKHKIICGGNHDFYLEERPAEELQTYFTNATYIENESVTIMGIKFNNWAWMLNTEELRHVWNTIPDNTDIVITHSPPFGILDSTPFSQWPCGCHHLLNRLNELKPKYHIFGHIHAGYGVATKNGTTYINASILNDHYKLVNKPKSFYF